MKAKSTTHIQAKTKKAAGTLLRENDALSDREIVAARLARAIGRGRDAIYHGTRAPAEVLRSGKLMPRGGGVSFSRSPEVAAYHAHMMGSGSCSVVAPSKTPIRFMRSFCCARAAIGDATAAPPRSVMNSRRFISLPELATDVA